MVKPSDMPQTRYGKDEGLVSLETEMAAADLRLSLATSRRRRSNRDRFLNLRNLLVRRLRPGAKAILRIRVKENLQNADAGKYTVYCEPCCVWFRFTAWGEEFECPKCGSLYAIEVAVYARIEKEESE